MPHLLTMGDARRLPLTDKSVHCVVTSPPYYALRDYGTAAWEGGEPWCDHVQGTGRKDKGRLSTDDRPGVNPSPVDTPMFFRDTCGKCGARRVDRQLGLEQSPEQYLAAMVAVFREVKRVLRDDGVMFLNMGDSFGSGNSGQTKRDQSGGMGNARDTFDLPSSKANHGKAPVPGMSKQLLMMPHRLALALQADGCADPKAVAIIGRLRSSLLDSYDSWEDVPAPVRREIALLDAEYSQAKAGSWYVRMDCVWEKKNPMPESVTDRPTKAHEYVFLLAKRERYYWDSDAVKEKATYAGKVVTLGPKSLSRGQAAGIGIEPSGNGKADSVTVAEGRNLRSVWSIPTHAFKGAHFATMPVRLASTCIKAGTSQAGCCGTCGKPWQRLVERDGKQEQAAWSGAGRQNGCQAGGGHFGRTGQWSSESHTLGWQPACSCADAGPPQPCVVLDPFSGAASVGVAASALGRRYVGVDLSPKYLRMARRRLERPHARHEPPARVESLPLFPDEDD